MKAKPNTKLTQRCGGIFQADPEVPPDQNGRRACRCGLVGRPGDAHHQLPEVPEQAAHRERYEGPD